MVWYQLDIRCVKKGRTGDPAGSLAIQTEVVPSVELNICTLSASMPKVLATVISAFAVF